MTRRTGWMIGSVVALGAAVGVYAYSRAHRKQPARYETVKADRGRIIARVTATGTLSALVTVQVGSQVSGRIQQLHADFNSPVKKDQVIAKIDPALFQAAVEQARANYVAAQGNLAKAKVQAVDADRQYTRQKALFERKLVAQADLDTSQANADAARAAVAASEGAVEQNRAALHQAQVNLDYTTIKSPINGVVISRNVDVGQTVAASLQAPTLFTIAEDLKKMQVDTNVAEADVGKLAPQMVASFTVDAYPNEKFRGLIRQIRNAPQTVQNVVTYDAVIDVENPDLKLKPGMTANVTFIYAEKDDVLRVPNAALRFRPPPELLAALAPPGASGAKRPADGRSASGAQPAARTGATQRAPSGALRDGEVERKTVWVLRGSEPKPLKVKTGVSDGTQTEIVEGELAAGDALITEVGGDSGARPPTSGAPAALRRPF
ncbi:MAG TPA: efflux RND transporter periplasmic adaptor subunit [Polyangia bacterium]|nr:efflux RND transporter periplasmic adaptor subunit [Polyangia bacterium]